jgi:hypothetical protein
MQHLVFCGRTILQHKSGDSTNNLFKKQAYKKVFLLNKEKQQPEPI